MRWPLARCGAASLLPPFFAATRRRRPPLLPTDYLPLTESPGVVCPSLALPGGPVTVEDLLRRVGPAFHACCPADATASSVLCLYLVFLGRGGRGGSSVVRGARFGRDLGAALRRGTFGWERRGHAPLCRVDRLAVCSRTHASLFFVTPMVLVTQAPPIPH